METKTIAVTIIISALLAGLAWALVRPAPALCSTGACLGGKCWTSTDCAGDCACLKEPGKLDWGKCVGLD